MAHFYLNEHLASAAVGDTVELDGAEARHAVSVSRVQQGEHLRIGNGMGLVVTGPVTLATPQRLTIAVDSVQQVQQVTPSLWLAQALAKGDRDELAVQMATELGVDGVAPWAAERSIVKWEGAKVRKGTERWRAIVREASKQSLRAWIPEVAPPMTTKALAQLAAELRMLVLEPTADVALSSLTLDERDLMLVVGPEGGVSPPELNRLVSAGAEPVRLGAGVLRTSTAGPAAIAVLNTALGRW